MKLGGKNSGMANRKEIVEEGNGGGLYQKCIAYMYCEILKQ